MNQNLHPKHDMLLLQAMEEAATSKGGIIIPEAHRRTMNQGIVIEMGPDVSPVNFQEGEIVIFPLHSEYRIDADDTAYYMVRASEVIAGDGGAQAASPEGVGKSKLNRNKKPVEIPPPPLQEKRRPIGLTRDCKVSHCYAPAEFGSDYCKAHQGAIE